MIALRETLANWTDFDGAEFEVGKALGVIPVDATWEAWVIGKNGRKHVFWSSNPVGNALGEVLEQLVAIGRLERSEGKFRWNPAFDIDVAYEKAVTFTLGEALRLPVLRNGSYAAQWRAMELHDDKPPMWGMMQLRVLPEDAGVEQRLHNGVGWRSWQRFDGFTYGGLDLLVEVVKID